MPERPTAGRIWTGRLRVTAPIAAEQTFEFICDNVREAVYFEFEGEHPEHGDTIDLTVGVCDDPVVEGGLAVLHFPAVVTVFDPDLADEDAMSLVVRMVRECIEGWYETPERFRVSFAAVDRSREWET